MSLVNSNLGRSFSELLWPWNPMFWEVLRAGFARPLFSTAEPVSAADRAKYQPPAPGPTPGVPASGYTNVSAPANATNELLAADQAKWQAWIQEAIPAAPPGTEEPLSDLVWLAVGVGALSLFLLLRGRT